MISPLKTIDFDVENTPSKKKIVQNQINGWMQTCIKKAQSLKRQKLPCKFIISHSLNKQEKLMKFRDYKKSLVLYALEKYSQKTAESENQTKRYTDSPYKSQKYNEIGKYQRNIEISQFNDNQTHEIICFNENTKIALLKLPELTKKRAFKNQITPFQQFSNPIIESAKGNNYYLPLKYQNRRKLASIGRI